MPHAASAQAGPNAKNHNSRPPMSSFDTQLLLIALAIGCGSLFFNYANHAGFWMVKESFGMSMGEATKTITVVQSIVSFVGLLMVLLFNLLPKLG